jgi:nitrogen regulatory protein PII
MKMLIGVIRTSCLSEIVKELERVGILYVTITEVKWLGEETTVFSPYTIHNLIQIMVVEEKVNEVESIILRFGRLGIAGDGILTVCPVDYMIKIRTQEKFE